MVKYYNSSKGGVDTFDLTHHSLSTESKCRRWPMVIFYNLLDTVGIASQIIYRDLLEGNNLAKNKKRPEFQDLAKCLLVEYISRNWAKLRKPNVLLELSIQHVSEAKQIQKARNTPTPSKKRKTVQSRCLSCSRKNFMKVRQMCDSHGRFVCKEHCKTAYTC